MESELQWRYSRNQMRHWVSDGELYENGKMHPSGYELFEIRTSRETSRIRSPHDIFRLFFKGRFADSHRVVGVLKASAETLRKARKGK